MSQFNRQLTRQRLHARIRKKVRGTPERPRLCVFFSGRHIQSQVIDDLSGKTLAAASTLERGVRGPSARANVATAEQIGKLVAERLLAKNITQVVFDRGGFKYHGKVKALADAARSAGLQF